MKKYVLLIPVFILVACELAVDIDVPVPAPQLNVSALSWTDSTWRLDITKPRYILDRSYSYDSVTNATVTITDETAGRSITLKHTKWGRYRANEYPIAGHVYSIEVSAEGFETVTGKTTAPPRAVLRNMVIDTVKIINHFDGKHYYQMHAASFTFDDPVGPDTYEVEFYDFSVYPVERNGVTTLDSGYAYLPIKMNDPALVVKNDFLTTRNYPIRFTDNSFEGGEKTMIILLDFYWLHLGGGARRYGFHLVNQSPDYAKYVDGRNLQKDNDGNPFAEPAPVFSNLSNGYGIFAIKTFSTIELEWNKRRPQ